MSRSQHLTLAVAGVLFAVAVNSLGAQTDGLRRGVVEYHQPFVPDGPGPHPTILAFSGCGGFPLPDASEEAAHPELSTPGRIVRTQYPRSAERLREIGYAVVLVDVHRSEGVLIACGGEIPTTRVADYIDEAIDWAQSLSFVDPNRLHLLGWSMGATGVMTWVNRSDEEQSQRVRSAVAYYPQCRGRESLRVRTRLLMLLGGADQITLAALCQDLVERSEDRDEVVLHVYPGAHHSFDVEEAPPLMEMAPGRPVGYHPEASEAAWEALVHFVRTSG